MNHFLTKTLYMKRPKTYDWIFLGVVLFLATILFTQGDIIITYLHSNDLISAISQGKFFDFYSIVLNNAVSGEYLDNATMVFAANYNILVYLFLAIWLLPLRILYKIRGVDFSPITYTLWCKLLLILLILLSTYLIYRIVKKIGSSNDKSLCIAYLFCSSTILIFGTAIFGQLDIVTVALILTSLLFYLDKKYVVFCLILSIALCFKGFAVFVLLPLLLFSEKRILHLIKYLGISLIFPIITTVPFLFDPGYNETRRFMDARYGFMERLWATAISGGIYNISYFVLTFILICVFGYYLKENPKNKAQCMIALPLTTLASFFIFIDWHPQWVILLTPFLCLGYQYVKSTRLALLLDLFISIGYLLSSILKHPNNVDNHMLNHGILPVITGRYYSGRTIQEIYSYFGFPEAVPFTIFVACLISLIVLCCYEAIKKPLSENDKETVYERLLIWFRPIVILGFILVSVGLYIMES